MRGLKQERETVCLFKRESHLLQMRGLKLLLPLVPLLYLSRIFYRCVDWNFFRSIRLNIFRSHLLQMRGLKQMILMIFMRNIWSHLLQMRGLKLISTSLFAYRKLSHLLQMRGLKLMMYFTTTIINGSHLLQMRGLKPKPPILYNQKLCCRIFYRCVDWNLLNCDPVKIPHMSHLLQMRGLKQDMQLSCRSYHRSHLLQMRGLKQKTFLMLTK